METNNFNNSNESLDKIENKLEKNIDIIDDNDQEGSINVIELEAKIKDLESKNASEVNRYNKLREELGLENIDFQNEEIIKKEMPSSKSRFEKIKDYGNKLFKAAAVAGVMFGATDSFSQTTKTPDKNPEKTEIKTEIGNFYNRLQEYKIIPESMTALDFQEKIKDENWEKDILEKYKEARGIAKFVPPNAETIKVIQYGIDETLGQDSEGRTLSQEERKKELEKIWEDVKNKKYKLGDSVVLSDGSTYLIKQYKPNTYKKQDIAKQSTSTTSFKLLKDLKQQK